MAGELNIYNQNVMDNKKISETSSFNASFYILVLQSMPEFVGLKGCVMPILTIMIVIIGSLGNGLLIRIIVKHKDTTSVSNLMLLNLAAVDLFSLMFGFGGNLIVSFIADWKIGSTLCKFYLFFREICVGASVYTIVVISIQRFIVLTPFSKIQYRMKPYPLILIVWLIGTIIAAPNLVYGDIYDGKCLDGFVYIQNLYIKVSAIVKFFQICVIPLLTISILSIISAIKLRNSVHDLPEEVSTKKKLKRTRVMTSKMLIALVVLFAVSYIPFNILVIFYVWKGVNVVTSVEFIYVCLISFYMLSINTCLNPVALYIMSRSYRKHFNRYLNISSRS